MLALTPFIACGGTVNQGTPSTIEPPLSAAQEHEIAEVLPRLMAMERLRENQIEPRRRELFEIVRELEARAQGVLPEATLVPGVNDFSLLSTNWLMHRQADLAHELEQLGNHETQLAKELKRVGGTFNAQQNHLAADTLRRLQTAISTAANSPPSDVTEFTPTPTLPPGPVLAAGPTPPGDVDEPGGPEATPAMPGPLPSPAATATPSPMPTAADEPTATPVETLQPTATLPPATPTPAPMPPAPVDFAGFNVNLLNGGDGERDSSIGADVLSASGWTTYGGLTTVDYGQAGGFPTQQSLGPQFRGKSFISGGPSIGNDTSGALLLIDISSEGQLVGGNQVWYQLSGHLGGTLDQADAAELIMTFTDTSQNVLEVINVGPVRPENRGSLTALLYRTAADRVPVGATFIKVELRFTGEGDYIHGYADNLSLQLTVGPPTSG
ncbi:MAG: hypothetical protein WD208_01680 [Dehalococcoidia bacterium]